MRSKATATFNGRIGYRISAGFQVEFAAFNIGNRKLSAIDYYYRSRLPGEAAGGLNDVHFHPIESRSFRLALMATFWCSARGISLTARQTPIGLENWRDARR